MSWLNNATIKTAEDKAAEVAAEQAAEAKRQQAEAKLTGIEFQGVMCSAHKEDQWGLDSVRTLVRSNHPVPFHFKNGNVLTLTAANIDDFESVWVPFRMSFFQ